MFTETTEPIKFNCIYTEGRKRFCWENLTVFKVNETFSQTTLVYRDEHLFSNWDDWMYTTFTKKDYNYWLFTQRGSSTTLGEFFKKISSFLFSRLFLRLKGNGFFISLSYLSPKHQTKLMSCLFSLFLLWRPSWPFDNSLIVSELIVALWRQVRGPSERDSFVTRRKIADAVMCW